VIDLNGLSLLPGLVDLHVHFREPGYEYKETIKGGYDAARAGGFTTVCTMPNLNPAPDSPENLEVQLKAIRECGTDVEIRPYACITVRRKGSECVDFESILDYAESKGVVIAGFSDDGSGIQQSEPMLQALKESSRLGFTIAAHCEVNSLLKGGYIHDGEYARTHGHKGICSESEWGEVKRDIELAEHTGGNLHICHVSTKESVDLVREAKKRGVKVTCETGPHYLAFCDTEILEDGRFKMNPPIRSSEDRDALIEGVADGTIDAIATDHAPHSSEEKSKGLAGSAMGVVGLETAFSAVYTYMVKRGHINMHQLIKSMSLNPRRILGMTDKYDGRIMPGNVADFTIVNLDAAFTVDPSAFQGQGRATPFEGVRLYGQVVATIKAPYDKVHSAK
ncbi:MAG: dihydroorotase, partial [Muribaculum sp.]|nr:dihydroorotase [Muribaculum sp.]